MKGQYLGIRRDKDAVTFIESDAAAVVGNGPAAIDTEQHTKRNTICPVVYFLPPFGIDDHAVDLKILAAGQQFRGDSLPVFQHTQRLAGSALLFRFATCSALST